MSMLLTNVKIGTMVQVAANNDTNVAVTAVPCLFFGATAIATTVIIAEMPPCATPHKNLKNNNSLKLLLKATITLAIQ